MAHNPHPAPNEAAAEHYFDAELYRQHTAIERTNAWLDSFKILLGHYETDVQNWLAFHFLAFTVLLVRKIPPNEKPWTGSTITVQSFIRDLLKCPIIFIMLNDMIKE